MEGASSHPCGGFYVFMENNKPYIYKEINGHTLRLSNPHYQPTWWDKYGALAILCIIWAIGIIFLATHKNSEYDNYISDHPDPDWEQYKYPR